MGFAFQNQILLNKSNIFHEYLEFFLKFSLKLPLKKPFLHFLFSKTTIPNWFKIFFPTRQTTNIKDSILVYLQPTLQNDNTTTNNNNVCNIVHLPTCQC